MLFAWQQAKIYHQKCCTFFASPLFGWDIFMTGWDNNNTILIYPCSNVHSYLYVFRRRCGANCNLNQLPVSFTHHPTTQDFLPSTFPSFALSGFALLPLAVTKNWQVGGKALHLSLRTSSSLSSTQSNPRMDKNYIQNVFAHEQNGEKLKGTTA